MGCLGGSVCTCIREYDFSLHVLRTMITHVHLLNLKKKEREKFSLLFSSLIPLFELLGDDVWRCFQLGPFLKGMSSKSQTSKYKKYFISTICMIRIY